MLGTFNNVSLRKIDVDTYFMSKIDPLRENKCRVILFIYTSISDNKLDAKKIIYFFAALNNDDLKSE